MKILSISAVIFIVLPLVVQDSKIHGTWYHKSPEDEFTLILRTDGTGELDDEVIKYKLDKNTIIMTAVQNDEVLVYKYSLQENSLTISGGDLEAPITFVRKVVQKKG